MPLPAKAFTASMVSGGTFSSAIDLGYGWTKICVAIPSMASGADLYFQAADSLNGTYRRIFHAPTVTSAAVVFTVASGITNCILPLHVSPQFVRVEATTAPASTAYTFTFICSE